MEENDNYDLLMKFTPEMTVAMSHALCYAEDGGYEYITPELLLDSIMKQFNFMIVANEFDVLLGEAIESIEEYIGFTENI